MTPEQFTYWLQGYAELNADPPSLAQWQAIRDHLATVFHKVTPNWDDQPAFRRLDPRNPPYFPPGYPTATGVVFVDSETRLVC